jgi:predicted RNA-binding Zn-ribbon protein involved in translation (DUF1610 family)
MAKKEMVCTTCGSLVSPRSETPGSFWIELLLWAFFIVPGVIYSVWRLASVHKVCPKCGGKNLVPPDSPVGRKPTPEEQPTIDDLTKSCPDCAESVKAAALVCRFCGHKFTIEESKKSLEEARAALRGRLLCALDDDEWEARISAVNGLKMIGDPSVAPRLFDAMASAVRKANSWKTDQWDDKIAQGTRLFSTAVVEALVSFREAGLPYLVKSLDSNPLQGETAGLLVRMGAPAAELLEKAIPSSEGKARKRMERIVSDIRRKLPSEAY